MGGVYAGGDVCVRGWLPSLNAVAEGASRRMGLFLTSRKLASTSPFNIKGGIFNGGCAYIPLKVKSRMARRELVSLGWGWGEEVGRLRN